jgi:uncharacterized membrane protein YoaK (UPF0700 family)
VSFPAIRRILAAERTAAADAQLGLLLTFVAGAVNAGGFLAVGRYTSHMTGIFSSLADDVARGAAHLLPAALALVGCFVAGSAASAVLVNWARRRKHASPFALPVAVQAALLGGLGVAGWLAEPRPGAAAGLLCIVMGLQNATITKISGARIRTTHLTGMITDLGIELGKLAYEGVARGSQASPPVIADRGKLALLSALLGSFFLGGVAGALGYYWFGPAAALPIALPLLFLAAAALHGRP